MNVNDSPLRRDRTASHPRSRSPPRSRSRSRNATHENSRCGRQLLEEERARECQRLQSELLHERAEGDKVRQRCIDLQRELSAALDSAAEAECSAVRAARLTDTLRAELEEERVRERRTVAEAEALRRRCTALDGQLTEFRSENEALRRGLDGASRDDSRDRAALRDGEAQLVKAGQLIENYQAQITVAEEQLAVARGARAELEERVSSLTRDAEAKGRRLEAVLAATRRVAESSAAAVEDVVQMLERSTDGASEPPELRVTEPPSARALQLQADASAVDPDAAVAVLFTRDMANAVSAVREAATRAAAKLHSAARAQLLGRSQLGQVDEDLRAALSENSALSARCAAAEVQIARLTADAQAVARETARTTAATAQRLALLADVLGTVGEWTAVETQAAALVRERDDLRATKAELGERLGRAKAQLDDVWREHDDRLQTAIRAIKREIETKALDVRSSVENRMLGKSGSSELDHTSPQSRVKPEDVREGLSSEHDRLQRKYAEALALIDELRAAQRQQRDELQLSRAKMELLQATQPSRRTGNHSFGPVLSPVRDATHHERQLSCQTYHQPQQQQEQQHDSRMGDAPERCEHSQQLLMVLLLQVLHGAWSDLQDVVAQRRVLQRVVAKLEDASPARQRRQLWDSSAATPPPPPQSLLLRFRVAAVAVLAAGRLRRLGRTAARFATAPARSAFVSPTHGAARARIPVGAAPVLAAIAVGGRPEANQRAAAAVAVLCPLPDLRDVARNPPLAVITLADRVAYALTTGSSEMQRRGYPSATSLAAALANGLAAALRRGGPRAGNIDSAFPLAPPRLVDVPQQQRVVHVAAPPLAPLPHSSTPQHARDSSAIATPRAAKGDGRATPRSAQRQGGASALTAASPIAASRAGHSVVVGNADDSSAAGAPSEEFTVEVLNVIRALDSRISGALRRSMYAMSPTHARDPSLTPSGKQVHLSATTTAGASSRSQATPQSAHR